jgi:hypothetical protein
VDKGTTLGGLESEDDVEPSHRFVAFFLVYGAEAILEDKGLRRPKQLDQPRRLVGPAGSGSGRGLTTLGTVSVVPATLPRSKGSAPRLPSGRLGTSAATRRPRVPQAYSSLGRALHHH